MACKAADLALRIIRADAGGLRQVPQLPLSTSWLSESLAELRAAYRSGLHKGWVPLCGMEVVICDGKTLKTARR